MAAKNEQGLLSMIFFNEERALSAGHANLLLLDSIQFALMLTMKNVLRWL